MNKLCRRSVSVLFFGLFVQASVNTASAEINDGIGHSIGKSTSNNTPAMGANHPPTSMSNNHPAMGKGQMPANMPKMPEGPKRQGKVLEVTNGAGYSYLQIEAGGQKFWIAGTQISAKAGDVVSFVENVTMDNFTSKTLKRTFDRIVFASTVAVVE
ncbi:MAG: hypothetical protein OEX07_01625 [Gammaproteobacteria bacterium]|nr:hypothetical protein [Gammaproteobacteria bacterium]